MPGKKIICKEPKPFHQYIFASAVLQPLRGWAIVGNRDKPLVQGEGTVACVYASDVSAANLFRVVALAQQTPPRPCGMRRGLLSGGVSGLGRPSSSNPDRGRISIKGMSPSSILRKRLELH